MGSSALLAPPQLLAQSWESIAPMRFARAEHKSIVLSDQRVLVVGGIGADGKLVMECEIYDVPTNTWSSGGTLNQGRRRLELIRLPDGKIVAISGMVTNTGAVTKTNEIYDPLTNAWMRLPNLVRGRSTFSAVLLPDTTIAIIGGLQVSQTLNKAEILDPVRGLIRELPDMLVPVWALNTHYSTSSHAVIARGGSQNGADGPYLKSTQMFSLETQQWSMLPDAMSAQSTPDKGAIVLDDERILVPSGRSGKATLTPLVESFDAFTGAWQAHGDLVRDHDVAQVVRAGWDSILVIGGDADPPDYTTIIRECSWFDHKKGQSTIGPSLLTERFRHQAETIILDDDSACMTRQVLIVTGGLSQNNEVLSSCEKLEIGRKPKAAKIIVSPQVLALSAECETITSIEINADACEAIKLTRIDVSGNIYLDHPQLPVEFSRAFMQVRGKAYSSGSIRLTFSTPVGEQVRYIRVTQSGGSAGILSMPASLSMNGTRCSSSSLVLPVSNTFCDDVTIESIEAEDPYVADISVAETLPITIEPKKQAQFTVTYTGTTDAISTKLRVRFRRGDNVSDTLLNLSIVLEGDPPRTSRAIMPSQLSNYVGDVITLPLNLTQADGITGNGYELELTYDTDLLQIVSPEFSGTVTPASIFDLTPTPTGVRLFVPADVSLSSNEPLIKFKVASFVAPNKCTQVKLSRLTFSPEDPGFASCMLAVALDSAMICVQDQCGDQSLRQAMMASDEGISRIAYGEGRIVVEYNAVVDAMFELYDMLGQRVDSRTATASPFTIFTHSLPAGAYILRMTTPLSTRSKRITIMR